MMSLGGSFKGDCLVIPVAIKWIPVSALQMELEYIDKNFSPCITQFS